MLPALPTNRYNLEYLCLTEICNDIRLASNIYFIHTHFYVSLLKILIHSLPTRAESNHLIKSTILQILFALNALYSKAKLSCSEPFTY